MDERKTEVRESEIEEWLNREIKKLGGRPIKFTSPSASGVPDRLYVLPGGRVWFVELKAEEGAPSKLQCHWGKILTKLGCNYRLIIGMQEAMDFEKELRHGISSS